MHEILDGILTPLSFFSKSLIYPLISYWNVYLRLRRKENANGLKDNYRLLGFQV